MALINPIPNDGNKEYLRIKSVHTDFDYIFSMDYAIYLSKEQRNNPEAFPYSIIRDNLHLNSGALQTEMNKKADPNLTIWENVKRAGYIAIHNDNFEFSGWEDDI